MEPYKLTSLIDFLLLPVYLAVFYQIAYAFRNRHYRRNHPWRPYFIPLLTLKIVGALFISFIYMYYYDGGDTTNIYDNAYTLNEIFKESTSTWWKLVTRTIDRYDPVFATHADGLYFYWDKATYTVCIITSFVNFLTLQSFIVTAVVFAFLSFWGIWALFRAFATLYPKLTKPIAYATLFVPSTIVWGSGVFKDTVCLFALGWLFNSTVQLVVKRAFNPRVIAIAGLSFWLLTQIKLYIALSFLPALLLWIFYYYSRSIRRPLARRLARLALLGIIGGVIAVGLNSFASQLGEYSLENIARTSEKTRGWINYISGDEGSTYDLGAVGSGIGGMLAKFPAAVNVTLFRPYPWEARKPIVALTALEALLFLFVTLKIIFTIGIKRIWKTISLDPTVQFCLVFTLIFAFAVGISSYNFGTLSRYKIPCMPFYAAALLLIYYQNRPMKKKLLPFL